MNTLTTYQDLVSKLQSNPIITPEELADTILKIGNYFDIQAPPPIVNIAQDFGFSVFLQPNMNPNESGNIYIGGTTANYYHSNKVIIVSDQIEYFHQRFIVTHELGHYLMNYFNNPEYSSNPKKLFTKPYYNNKQNDKQANKFAMELLMPQHLFARQYIKAVERYYDRCYTLSYLSSFFKVTKSLIKRHIKEIIF